jgi:hypothetical protein
MEIQKRGIPVPNARRHAARILWTPCGTAQTSPILLEQNTTIKNVNNLKPPECWNLAGLALSNCLRASSASPNNEKQQQVQLSVFFKFNEQEEFKETPSQTVLNYGINYVCMFFSNFSV